MEQPVWWWILSHERKAIFLTSMLTYPAGLMVQTMVWAFVYSLLCVWAASMKSYIIWNQLLYVRNGGNR